MSRFYDIQEHQKYYIVTRLKKKLVEDSMDMYFDMRFNIVMFSLSARGCMTYVNKYSRESFSSLKINSRK